MKTWLDSLGSELHKNHLKALGYRKVRRTFSRDMGGYVERFNLQASWNAPGLKQWSYFVNVGVEFNDLPKKENWFGQPNVHWSQRIESILENVRDIGRYSERSNPTEQAIKLARYISESSEIVGKEILGIREHSLNAREWEPYPFGTEGLNGLRKHIWRVLNNLR
ncbi:MAG: DUF4304 domain-containing protein [Pyrinomonadaceae bacterium]